MSARARLDRALEGLSPALLAYAVAVVEAGALSEGALCEWLDGERGAGREVYDLSEQLPSAGLVGEFELTQRLGRHLGVPVVGEVELEMFSSAHPALDRALCAEYGLICLSDEPKSPLPMAVSNPLDEEVLAYVSSLVGEPLKVHLARLSDIAREVDACYGTAEEWAEYVREQAQAPNAGHPDPTPPRPAHAPHAPQGLSPQPPAQVPPQAPPQPPAQVPPQPPAQVPPQPPAQVPLRSPLIPLWRTPEEDGGSIEAFKRLLGGGRSGT